VIPFPAAIASEERSLNTWLVAFRPGESPLFLSVPVVSYSFMNFALLLAFSRFSSKPFGT